VNLRLLAFSTGGVLVGDWIRYLPYGPVSESGSWEALGEAIGLGGFTPGVIPPAGEVAFPGVAIAPLSPQGGTPAVVLIDRFNRQTFTFRFCVGASCASAEAGLHELFSTPHAPHSLLSSPVTLPSRQTIIGASDGVVFTPPSEPLQQPPITGLGEVHAPPLWRRTGGCWSSTSMGSSTGSRMAW
jgi:hypothetical protein